MYTNIAKLNIYTKIEVNKKITIFFKENNAYYFLISNATLKNENFLDSKSEIEKQKTDGSFFLQKHNYTLF